ncbi:MAG: metallophosphoesterase family protein [Rhodocyclales bacterium]|nr:metallophosphoesterase family protein [Rhodocyclales bacterium]
MRFAVVSDINGNLPALEAVVADCRGNGVDAVINLGDSLSGPLLPRETARYLQAQDWTHLAGNHERQILEAPTADNPDPVDVYARSQLEAADLAWIASLLAFREFSAEIYLCHATPRRDDEYFLESVIAPQTVRLATPREIDERLGAVRHALVLCGHTHVPRAVRTARGQLIVNPGSVGLPAFDDERPYFHVIENGAPDARYAIVEHRGAGWSASLVAVPYDFETVAQLAGRRGREEWAQALRTGYMN